MILMSDFMVSGYDGGCQLFLGRLSLKVADAVILWVYQQCRR
jgi:hypothetical protein